MKLKHITKRTIVLLLTIILFSGCIAPRVANSETPAYGLEAGTGQQYSPAGSSVVGNNSILPSVSDISDPDALADAENAYRERMQQEHAEAILAESKIADYVNTNDYSLYNSIYSTNYCFQRIGRYEVCPAGSYKIALAIGQSGSGDYDYHWYRQDSDGLWSHKPGGSAVTRLDSSYQLIVDPQSAARDYTSSNGYNYSTFLGYYAVTAWNNMYDTNDYCGYWFLGQGGWTLSDIYLFLSLYSSRFCSIEDIVVSNTYNLSLFNHRSVK